ncbi:LIM and SH3 domain protein 1-like isoform X2 [Penaeus indicus]|uniref:LIM and SH3 domain protein 1-like isoform X2 n=1 Tax=Penaeus indicus TaxID=29960 RepID=UPI00300C8B26
MSKRCARCEKTVYPLEELKCLDKIWHKGCFKCQECGMTLSMKTYKGFNKLPYCEAHIPKAKATTVAETPEMRRLAENTKIQSNVQYHADFEKNKAKFTQVADDPETQRLKKNTKIISNVAYHGELERKAEMERKRSEPGEEDEEYPPWLEVPGRDVLTATTPIHPPTHSDDDLHGHELTRDPTPQSQPPHSYDYSSSSSSSSRTQPPPPAYHHSQSPPNYQTPAAKNSFPAAPYHAQSSSHYPTPAYDSGPHSQHGYHSSSGPRSHNANTYHPSELIEQSGYYLPNHMDGQNASINRYSDQPTNGSSGAYPSTNRHGASHTYYPTNSHYAMQQQPNRRVGSIADYDPVNEQYGSISQHTGSGGYRQETSYQVQRSNLYGDPTTGQQPPPQHLNSNAAPHHKVTAPPTQLGRCYRAMYDYEAADTDEVSFKDGDLIINCTAIDEGWMTGTIQRTGVTGMLPANYVERVS